MTKTQFYSLCAIRYIKPDVALRNQNILEALRNGAGTQEIECLLESEF